MKVKREKSQNASNQSWDRQRGTRNYVRTEKDLELAGNESKHSLLTVYRIFNVFETGPKQLST